VDLVEFNTTNVGDHKFEQIIFWVWSDERDRMEVSDYIMDGEGRVRDVRKVGPYYFVHTGNWVGEVVVRARRIQYTTTNHDPERENARLLSSEYRLGLVYAAQRERANREMKERSLRRPKTP